FRLTGILVPGALSIRAFGLKRALGKIAADIYFAHNIETLLPATRAAEQSGALPIFDSMEFHSDMGGSQLAIERRLIRAIERRCLRKCALVLASSDQIAEALVADYGIARPLTLYNMPPLEKEIPPKPQNGLAL